MVAPEPVDPATAEVMLKEAQQSAIPAEGHGSITGKRRQQPGEGLPLTRLKPGHTMGLAARRRPPVTP
jgi:hypothetical protein